MNNIPSLEFSETPILVCKDFSVSQKVFELRQERNYDLLATFPKPDHEELSEFYKSENYISHTDSKETLFDKVYQKVKSYMLQKKLSWIQRNKLGKGSLLDIGAGTGDFLAEAKKNGWNVSGVEPNSRARELALKKGIPLQVDSRSFSEQEFDVITLWHVLEHIPDLDTQIRDLYRLLKKDGLLVIAVPNFKSFDAKVYKEYWAAFDVPRHLYHFSRTAIQKLFLEFGFEIMAEKGLPFDSYYVSLLSEKYRTGNPNYIKAVANGFLSNLKAKSTGEYSSIAYFIRKSP